MLALNVNFLSATGCVLTVNLSGDMPVPLQHVTRSQRSDDQSGRCIRSLLEDNNLSYSVQTGYAGGGMEIAEVQATPR